MASKLKAEIEAIIDTYKATADAYGKQIVLVLNDYKKNAPRYTVDGLQKELDEQIDPIMESWGRLDKVSNEKFHALIDDAEQEFKDKHSGGSVQDAPLKVNNALQLLQILHPETDEQAYTILKEFVDAKDYKNLDLFRQVLTKDVELENSSGEPVFSKTFGDLHGHNAVNNMFKELHEVGSEIFLHKTIGTDSSTDFRVGNKVYGVPMTEGYAQETDELQAVSFGEHIDRILNEGR